MTAVLGSPAGVRWSAVGARRLGRRHRDRPAAGPLVVSRAIAEPRLRLTSRCRSLLLVAALLAVVGVGAVHGSGPLGIGGARPRAVEGPALAPGMPLGTALVGPALGTSATTGAVRGGAGVQAGSVPPAAAAAAPTPASGVVIVAVGDSLWGIATRCSGAGPATAVSWIRSANGLRGSLLQPGQRLVVPSGLRCR